MASYTINRRERSPTMIFLPKGVLMSKYASMVFRHSLVTDSKKDVGFLEAWPETVAPDGKGCRNRVFIYYLIPRRSLIGRRPPRADFSSIFVGVTRLRLFDPPSKTRYTPPLDFSQAIRPAACTGQPTRCCVAASPRNRVTAG